MKVIVKYLQDNALVIDFRSPHDRRSKYHKYLKVMDKLCTANKELMYIRQVDESQRRAS